MASKLQKFLNTPVPEVAAMRVAAKAGDLFGIELECEGRNVAWCGNDPVILNHWQPHADGSLRDHHGQACEWVFNGPVNYKASVARVAALFDYFEKRKAKLVLSNRTSTHVHFNMADKNSYQVINLFILFTILEGLLDNYCGEDRVGNLFCLSSRHAEEQIEWVEDACFKHFHFGNFKDNQRYCSLNLASLNKFGTVEFRTMRGLDNRGDMLDWLSILNEFTQYACFTMMNPVDILQDVSVHTPRGFLEKVFSKDNVEKITKGVDENEINRSVYEGLRLVQMLCYKVGTEFDQVRVKGPDFWASLSADKAMFPDVDLEEEAIQARNRMQERQAPAPRRGGGLGIAALGAAQLRARARGDLPDGNPFLREPPRPVAPPIPEEIQAHREAIARAREALARHNNDRPRPLGEWHDDFNAD